MECGVQKNLTRRTVRLTYDENQLAERNTRKGQQVAGRAALAHDV